MNDKYDKILKSALKLFTQFGFQNTPTALIAKEAGVANGTLFHYFKSKETLIDSLYLYSKDSLTNALKSNLDINQNIPTIAKNMFINSIAWSVNNIELFRFFQNYSNSPFISELAKNSGEEKFTFLIELIENGKKNGYLKNIATEYLYSAITGIMIQMMIYFSKNPDKYKNQNNVNNAYTILWDAIKK